MIAKLAGVVEQIEPDAAVIDVGGVGYRAFCSARTIGRLPPPGSPARLLIETHVREDHIHLYGFIDAAERDWFRLLTTVQGVGARLALSLLSAVPPEKLGLAILAQDKPALAQAEGVGPRLAARIVNELRDKIGNVAAPMTAGSAALLTEAANGQGATADAIAALTHQIGGRPLWLAASTHPGEESIIAATHSALAARRPGLASLFCVWGCRAAPRGLFGRIRGATRRGTGEPTGARFSCRQYTACGCAAAWQELPATPVCPKLGMAPWRS